MRAIVLASTALALVSTASAQTIQDRLEKARTEVNTTQNAADRALTAIKKPDIAKATNEINATKNAASRALYAIDQALKAVQQPVPPPPPPPPPAFDDAPLASATGQLEVRKAIPSQWASAQSIKPYPVPPDNGSDPVGAFRATCGINLDGSDLNNDDALVYPGQPGKSHLHQYYGQTANAYSTYASLRAGNQSTCAYGAFPGNLSAYWMPAMMDGAGGVVRPNLIALYYKRLPKSSPRCGDPRTATGPVEGICTGIPTRFKMIAGYDMKGGYTAGFRLDSDGVARPMGYKCYATSRGNTVSPMQPTLRRALDLCQVGERVIVDINFPDCFDGRVDSPDHRAHVAYKVDTHNGYFQCPKTHPFMMPQLHVAPQYTITAALKATGRLSCAKDATEDCIHADYMEAWDEPLRLRFEAGAIDGHKNASAGDLGDGSALIGAAQPPYGWEIPAAQVTTPVPQSEIEYQKAMAGMAH